MILPVLLDSRPPYIGPGLGHASLLLAPVAATRVAPLIQSRLASAQKPIVLCPFEPDVEYVEAVRAACGAERVMHVSEFRPEETYEPSDWLLFVDPAWCSLDPLRLSSALNDAARSRSRATHLVALSQHAGGMGERVELSAQGQVRKVQRYYDGATWSRLEGVACSLVSASCLRPLKDPLPLDSLADLRTALTMRGIPSRDVTIEGPVFNLTRERELLRLNEHLVFDLYGGRDLAQARVDAEAAVHPSSRLVGPMVIQRGASIEAGAVVIGPSVIESGARVGRGARVVQSVVASGAVVPAEATIRGRALFHGSTHPSPAGGAGRLLPLDVARSQARRGRSRGYAAVKAAIDRLSALVALIVLAPLLAVIAAVIRIESGGSALFGDLREGRGGRLFKCLKFRTMRQGSNLEQRALLQQNQVDGPQFKLDKDPRVTRVGRWLRPTSLDELPQFVNVLRGEMSLIGPRPSPFRENQTCVPWREARLSVQPGITGLWQVCRHDRQDGDFHQWIYFDLLYVQHMSFWLDLKIAIATVLTLGGRHHVPLRWMIPTHEAGA
ncbi:MAG: sugar transferase [Acidobacteria bacterium]|nr:sugar transferase [Acidobacteriota bacterium]